MHGTDTRFALSTDFEKKPELVLPFIRRVSRDTRTQIYLLGKDRYNATGRALLDILNSLEAHIPRT